MKKTILILATLLAVSCSKDEVKQETTTVENCGAVESKQWVITNPECQYQINFRNVNNQLQTVCVTEEKFIDAEVGDIFCYGETIINN